MYDVPGTYCIFIILYHIHTHTHTLVLIHITLTTIDGQHKYPIFANGNWLDDTNVGNYVGVFVEPTARLR